MASHWLYEPLGTMHAAKLGDGAEDAGRAAAGGVAAAPLPETWGPALPICAPAAGASLAGMRWVTALGEAIATACSRASLEALPGPAVGAGASSSLPPD